jgi:hypothetical protein
MLRIYDGREGKHTIFLVIDDRVDRRIADDGQIFSQMTIRLCAPSESTNESSITLKSTYFVDRHQLFSSVRLRLVQWDELYVLRGLGLVAEWRRDGIQIVRANGSELSLPTDVLV